MEYISVIIYGIVQGITEFLPISSSGHLVIMHQILPLDFINEISFDVFLHLASLLAVIYFFRTDLFRIIIAWLKSLSGKKSDDARLANYLIVATIPAAFFGYFFADFIENKLRSLAVLVVMLVLIALLFIFVEKRGKFNRESRELSLGDAFFIGLAQVLALIPGTSRSGITIIAGMSRALKREEALRFSFLMSIPIILGAFLTKASDIGHNFNSSSILLLILAFLSTFFTAFFTIKFFMNFAKKHSLLPFAYYRIILAFILLLYLWF